MYSAEKDEVILRWEKLKGSVRKSSILFYNAFKKKKRYILVTNRHIDVQVTLPLTLWILLRVLQIFKVTVSQPKEMSGAKMVLYQYPFTTSSAHLCQKRPQSL